MSYDTQKNQSGGLSFKTLFLGVFIGFLIAAGVFTQSSEFNTVSSEILNSSNSSIIQDTSDSLTNRFSNPSIQELDLNGGEYSSEKVTVTGDVTNADMYANKEYSIEDNSGYSVLIECSTYLEVFDPVTKYRISGIVKNTSYTELGFMPGEEERIETVFIDCTSPPEAVS